METNYSCQHDGEGYVTTVENHYGKYKAWVCGNCGKEVPIDKLPPNKRHEIQKEEQRN